MRSTSAVVDDNLIDRVRAGQLPSPTVRRSIRRRARATLRDMAAELARCGHPVSPMTDLRWEQGASEPRLVHAVAYRELLDALEAATR